MRKSTMFLILAAALAACSDSSTAPGTGNTAGTNGGTGGSSAGTAGSSAGTTGGGGSGQGGQSGNMGASGDNVLTDAAAAGSGGSAGAPAEGGARDAAKSMMTFFITSTGSGAMGGNLGGVTGADKKCQDLAAAVGGGDHTWHAYLSTMAGNAKDRIGAGPWVNQKGTLIAANLTDLHTPGTSATMLGPNMLNTANGLDEKGGSVPGRAQTALPNEHDILTGSNPDGTLFMGDTCNDWTSSTTGTAYVGHFDRMGTNQPPGSISFNSAHAVNGCTEANLKSTGGAGRLYCFAID
jgi:hypothetical protein